MKLDLSITMRILLLKYCNASPSSSDLNIRSKLCEFSINSCVRLEHHNRHHIHHSRHHSHRHSHRSSRSLRSRLSRHSRKSNHVTDVTHGRMEMLR